MKHYTLQIRKPIQRSHWLLLAQFILLFSLAEGISRLDVFQAPLTPPKMGSRHYQLGHKLAWLDNEVNKNGPIDCVMIGSSIVDVGFNPDAFNRGYREVAGREIRCFNFGIDASTVVSTSALARILVEDYRPRLLIFGTDARDYAVPSKDVDSSVIMETPWVKYRQGDFSPEGWLLEHSYLYRYRQHLSRLVRLQFEGTVWTETNLNFPILPNGFTPLSQVSTYVSEPPNPQDDSFEITYNTRTYSDYKILEENLAALERILAYNESQTQVILVEMPVADGFYYFFGGGEADYNKFIDGVGEIANRRRVPFLQTEPSDFVPEDGWSDYSHLNVTGAEVFSEWLGGQVSEAEIRGGAEVFDP